MYSIKEISIWYNLHHITMAERLVELNIIPPGRGKGKKPRLTLSQLQPLFKECGCPKNLTLTLPNF